MRTRLALVVLLALTVRAAADVQPEVIWRKASQAAIRHCLSFTPGGAVLHSADGDTLDRWNVADLTLADCGSAGYPEWITPDGAYAVCMNGAVRLLTRVADRAILAQFTGAQWPVFGTASMSPDRTRVAAVWGDGLAVGIHDGETGAFVRDLTGHTAGITVTAFSPDGQEVASGDASGRIMVHRLSDGSVRIGLPILTTDCADLQYSPDGALLAAGFRGGRVIVYRVSDFKALRTFFTPAECLLFSPDSKSLAAGSTDQVVRVWRVADGKLLTSMRAHDGVVRALAFHPAQPILATTGADGQIRLWGLPSGTLVRSTDGPGGGLFDIAVSPDGRLVASAGYGGLDVRDARNGRFLWRTTEYNNPRVAGVVFSPDSRLVAYWGDQGFGVLGARVCRSGDGLPVRSLEIPGGAYVGAAAFSPDGRTVAGAEANGANTYLWDLATGAVVHTLTTDPADCLAFSPDGRRLAIGAVSPAGLSVWDVQTEHSVFSVGLPPYPRSVAYSPDGGVIAVGGWGVQLRSATDGALLRTVRAATGDYVRFTPDGTNLLVACVTSDQGIYIHRVSDGAEVAHWYPPLCELPMGSAFDPRGWTLYYGGYEGSVACARAPTASYSWSAEQAAYGTDGKWRVLWNHILGRASVWTVTAGMAPESGWAFGPYPGWSAEGLSIAPDRQVRLRWRGADDLLSLWTLTTGGQMQWGQCYSLAEPGRAVATATGADQKTRVLFETAEGAGEVWTIGTGGAVETRWRFGPYPEWWPAGLGVDSGGKVRLLWVKLDGTASLWRLGSGGALEQGVAFGPYAGWRALGITVGRDDGVRMLWLKSDGHFVVWAVGAGGAVERGDAYPGPTDRRPVSLYGGYDNRTYLLLRDRLGTAWLTALDTDGVWSPSIPYGPY